MDDRFALEPAVIRRAFNRARHSFAEAAVVHREVRTRALERLLLLRQAPKVILDLGAGLGHGSTWLKAQFPRAHVIAIDSALGMLQEGDRQRGAWRRVFNRIIGQSFSRACGDAVALPLRTESIDWVFSNLMLPWCVPLDPVLSEVRRVLKPDGVFAFTSFGPDTLRELRQAWREDAYDHVHPFIDMHDLGDGLVRAGFAEPVLDVERFTLTYDDIKALLNDLKAAGSGNALSTRARGLTGRTNYARLTADYETQRCDGKLPATYEVVYGQAWQSTARVRAVTSGETRIPLQDIGGRRK